MPPTTAPSRPDAAASPRSIRLNTVSYRAAAGLWAVAAVGVAAARVAEPFDHGWWLVAFLGLVGALSQVLLATGQVALARRSLHAAGGRRTSVGQLALWNAGTAFVPTGVFVGVAELVAAGSVALLCALASFAATTTAVRPGCPQLAVLAYRTLLLGLTVSVLVGAGLAEALPWQ